MPKIIMAISVIFLSYTGARLFMPFKVIQGATPQVRACSTIFFGRFLREKDDYRGFVSSQKSQKKVVTVFISYSKEPIINRVSFHEATKR